MACTRGEVVYGGSFSSRLIPKRGQVKMAIVLGLVHTVSSIFSLSGRPKRSGGAHIS